MWYWAVTVVLYVLAVLGVFVIFVDGGTGYLAAKKKRLDYERVKFGMAEEYARLIREEKEALRDIVLIFAGALFVPPLWIPVLMGVLGFFLYRGFKNMIATLRLKPPEDIFDKPAEAKVRR